MYRSDRSATCDCTVFTRGLTSLHHDLSNTAGRMSTFLSDREFAIDTSSGPQQQCSTEETTSGNKLRYIQIIFNKWEI